MHKNPLLILLGLFLVLLSIFLPYIEYDVKEFHGFFSLKQRKFISVDTIMYGSKTSLTYFTFLLIIIPSIIYALNKTKKSAKRLFVFSIGLILVLIALYFGLTAEPSFYNGYYNVRIKSGFLSSFIGVMLICFSSFKLLKTSEEPNILSLDKDLLDSDLTDL